MHSEGAEEILFHGLGERGQHGALGPEHLDPECSQSHLDPVCLVPGAIPASERGSWRGRSRGVSGRENGALPALASLLCPGGTSAPGAGLSVLAVRLSAAEALGGQAPRTPTLLPVQAIVWLLWSRRLAGTKLRLARLCEAFSKEPPACGPRGAGPAAVFPAPLCLRRTPWHRPCDRVSERHLRPAPSQWLACGDPAARV